jgi:hypothetical protein
MPGKPGRMNTDMYLIGYSIICSYVTSTLSRPVHIVHLLLYVHARVI